MAARIRQLLALALLVHHAVDYFMYPREHGLTTDLAWDWGTLLGDPATPAFILLSLVGVGLRLFWGRYLTICFSAALLVVHAPHLYWFIQEEALARELLMPMGRLAVILLLSGRSMAAFFEQRPSRFNRWAGADPRIVRLRYLILVQALFVGFAYAVRSPGDVMMSAILVLGGLGLLGLTFLKTWSLFALAGAMALEAIVVGQLVWCAAQPRKFLPLGFFAVVAAVFALLLLVSVVLAAPFLRRVLRQLRG
jgi:hypothetical protein